jgi:hypothetical protein
MGQVWNPSLLNPPEGLSPAMTHRTTETFKHCVDDSTDLGPLWNSWARKHQGKQRWQEKKERKAGGSGRQQAHGCE